MSTGVEGWVSFSSGILIVYHFHRCAAPPPLAKVALVDLEHKHSQMRCQDKYGNRPQNDGALLIGLLIGVLVGIPFTAAVILIYRRGCFGLIRRGPADFSRAFYSRATNDDF